MSPIPSSTPQSETAWRYDPESIKTMLAAAGFDIELAPSRLQHGGGSVSARFVRANRTVFLTLDAGGRVRVAIQTNAGESTHTVSVPTGPTLIAVCRETHEESLTGRAQSIRDLAAIIAYLCHDDGIKQSDERESVPE